MLGVCDAEINRAQAVNSKPWPQGASTLVQEMDKHAGSDAREWQM